MTRRGSLRFALVFAPALQRLTAGSREPFWNTKEPADWNQRETSEILNHSPWARQASTESRVDTRSDSGLGGLDSSAEARGGMRGNAGVGGTGGMGGAGMGGRSGSGGMDDSPGGMASRPQYRILVRWESALPVAAALKKPLPADASQAYTVSMTGVDLPRQSSNPETRRIGIEGGFKETTSLQRKSHDPISPQRVELVEQAGTSTLRFTFPHDPHPIAAEDKEVLFVSSIGRLTIRAKFSLKDMTYRSQLAL